jgi:hypothetical protein
MPSFTETIVSVTESNNTLHIVCTGTVTHIDVFQGPPGTVISGHVTGSNAWVYVDPTTYQNIKSHAHPGGQLKLSTDGSQNVIGIQCPPGASLQDLEESLERLIAKSDKQNALIERQNELNGEILLLLRELIEKGRNPISEIGDLAAKAGSR